jgi:monoamine oxidase
VSGLARQAGSFDVVVIGAGLAGLTTAWKLRSQDIGVVVLEAKDRPGGRLLSLTTSNGIIADGGGSWVGRTHAQVISLLDELSLHLVPQYHDGDNVLRINGRMIRYRGDVPRLGVFALLDIGHAMWALDRIARRLGPPPWSGSFAARLDAQTVGSWMDRRVRTSAGRLTIAVATAASFCCRPEELSLLAFAAHIGGAGGFGSLIAVSDGALAYRITEGAAALTSRIADALSPSLRLNSPVARITRDAVGVTVTGTDGCSYRGRRAVVAVDPATAGRIEHDPPLPMPRRELQERYTLGSGIKAHVVYDRPWWREDGLSGSAASDTGTTRLTFDVSPPATREGEPAGVLLALMGLAATDDPDILAPQRADERRNRVIADLARFFGPQARGPVDYIEHDWAQEQWQSGCLPRLQPGVLARGHQWLAHPLGTVHWAGTETSYEWEGHMEGAVRSGIRAADEVVASLGGTGSRCDTGKER